ncbi:MAG: Beta-galactosidase C-terminal domain, partial [Pseudolactococcus laudensis]|uniref:Beta-galactosidase C-terminal domain n=2 Tax=Pseudolactococcus TaxID=3436058 RepID=UPI003F9E24FE
EKNVAAAQANPDSILNLYKFLIQLRHEYQDISEGNITFLFPEHPTVLAYERGEFLIVTNLSATPTTVTFERPRHDYQDMVTQALAPDLLDLSLEGWAYRIYKKNKKTA